MIVYLAHPLGVPPVGPTLGAATVRGNIRLAKKWLRWAIKTYPDVTVIAPWILTCEVLDDSNLKDRARGFAMNQDVLARCDQVWLVGPRTSNGMREEGCWMAGWGKPVLSVTHLEMVEPPRVGTQLTWMAWTPSDYAGHQEAIDAARAKAREAAALKGPVRPEPPAP